MLRSAPDGKAFLMSEHFLPRRLLSLVLLLAVVWAASACPPRKRLVHRQPHGLGLMAVQAPAQAEDKVKKAIRDGMRYLRGLENGRGDFEHTTVLARIRP